MLIDIECIDCWWSSCRIFLDLLKNAGGSCSVVLCFVRLWFWNWKAMLEPAQVSMPSCESIISKVGTVSRIMTFFNLNLRSPFRIWKSHVHCKFLKSLCQCPKSQFPTWQVQRSPFSQKLHIHQRQSGEQKKLCKLAVEMMISEW